MKYPLILCLLLVSLSTTISGQYGPHSGSRDGKIIGGYDASPRSHPYLVSLQMRFIWIRMRICSGSLLNERWWNIIFDYQGIVITSNHKNTIHQGRSPAVGGKTFPLFDKTPSQILTAGHCVKGSWLMNWLRMEAVVGTNDLENKDSTAQTVRISERIPHPDYEGGIGTYDIAMLRTAKNILYNNAVSPIQVPLSTGGLTHRTQNLILAGWGVLETTLFIPALPDKLQEARVEYLPFDECKEAIDAALESYEDNPLDRVGNICTGPITGGVAACSGDSGGPLIQYILYNNEETTTVNTHLTKEDIEYETTAFADINIGNELELNDNISAIENKDKRSMTAKEISAVADIVQNYKDDGLTPVLIGVVSWGISPCGEVGAPTVYTNVSTYADFIHKHFYK